MAYATIEHVNLTVRDARKTARLLCRIFDWKLRWEGPSALGGHTCHVGTGEQYLAIHMKANPEDYPGAANKAYEHFNHVGIVTDNLAIAEQRIIKAGFEPFSHGDYSPGRRFYFRDEDGIEYEVVSYTDSLEQLRIYLNHEAALDSCFVAFIPDQPVSTWSENALVQKIIRFLGKLGENAANRK